MMGRVAKGEHIIVAFCNISLLLYNICFQKKRLSMAECCIETFTSKRFVVLFLVLCFKGYAMVCRKIALFLWQLKNRYVASRIAFL